MQKKETKPSALKKGQFFVGTILVVGVLWFTGQNPSMVKSASASTTGEEICPKIAAKSPEIISSWRSAGVISNNDLGRMTVRENKWRAAGNDARVSIALAMFCLVNPAGKGIAFIRSYETDSILMTVDDGNVF